MGLSLPDGRLETKYEVWRLGNGQDSPTRFVADLRLTRLVRGANGAGYAEASVGHRRDIQTWHWGSVFTAPDGTA